MDDPLGITQEFEAWDGRKVADLEPLADSLPQCGATLWILLDVLSEAAESRQRSPAAADRMEVAATWALKHVVEAATQRNADAAFTDVLADENLGKALIVCLDAVEANDAQLHLLQCLPHVSLGADSAPALAKLLKRLESSEHKFVRAWLFNTYGLLGKLDPSRVASIRGKLRRALEAESASVKVRCRHALKLLD